VTPTCRTDLISSDCTGQGGGRRGYIERTCCTGEKRAASTGGGRGETVGIMYKKKTRKAVKRRKDLGSHPKKRFTEAEVVNGHQRWRYQIERILQIPLGQCGKHSRKNGRGHIFDILASPGARGKGSDGKVFKKVVKNLGW